MKHAFLATVLATSLGLVTAGCDDSKPPHTVKITVGHNKKHYKPGDGSINVEKGNVLIRAGGTDVDASVSGDGSLTLGDKLVDVSAEGRKQLKAYNLEAVTMEAQGIALGLAGAHFGINTAKEVLHGLFNGTADEAGKRAEAGAEELGKRAQELCTHLDKAFHAQQAAADAVPEFKPYAVIAEHQVHECFEDEKDDHDGKDDDDGHDSDDDKPDDKSDKAPKA